MTQMMSILKSGEVVPHQSDMNTIQKLIMKVLHLLSGAAQGSAVAQRYCLVALFRYEMINLESSRVPFC